MLNYKIERLLFALLWITLICFFSFAIPPQTVTLLVQYQYTMSSLILTALIFYLYTKIRNKRVLNVINRYLTMNEFEKCNLYLEKCIRRQPKVFWLKFQKLMMIALKGEITQFKSYSDIIISAGGKLFSNKQLAIDCISKQVYNIIKHKIDLVC